MSDTKKKDATENTDGTAKATPARFTLKTGTVVQVDGTEVRLVADTEIEASEDDREALAKHDSTTFAEYPKRVTKDGVEKNVNGPEEEAEFLGTQADADAPQARKTGLEDVTFDDEDASSTRKGSSSKKK